MTDSITDSLPIGILHLDITHRQIEENRRSLVTCAVEAARRGARLIVAPELAISGYSFEGRDDVSGCVEELHGETLDALSPVAKKHGAFICVGFAERDPDTDIYYNSALVVGPNGRVAAHHRKIAAERRWARPGAPSHANIFDTPWGRLGLLICADSYYGLLPRSLAVQGADLLLVLANWPPSGLDARVVWRARALENGMGIVGCNRTGVDRIMDCRTCRSYVVTATGEALLDEASETSNIWMVDYPLVDGRLASEPRKAMMARRRPEDFAALYLDVNNLDDFSGLWGLPEGGPMDIRCVVPASSDEAWRIPESTAAQTDGVPTLLVLPCGFTPSDMERMLDLVSGRSLAVVVAQQFFSSSRQAVLSSRESSVTVDFGPARIALVRSEAMVHPEVAVSLSKQGCDVVVTAAERLDADDRLLFGARSLDRVVVAAAAPDGAIICEPPAGHSPWREEALHGPGLCAARIDTAPLRTRRFQDRVDMEALLRR